jgi:hypothetical protein
MPRNKKEFLRAILGTRATVSSALVHPDMNNGLM